MGTQLAIVAHYHSILLYLLFYYLSATLTLFKPKCTPRKARYDPMAYVPDPEELEVPEVEVSVTPDLEVPTINVPELTVVNKINVQL